MHNWVVQSALCYRHPTASHKQQKKNLQQSTSEWTEHIEIIKWFRSKYDLWFDGFFSRGFSSLADDEFCVWIFWSNADKNENAQRRFLCQRRWKCTDNMYLWTISQFDQFPYHLSRLVVNSKSKKMSEMSTRICRNIEKYWREKIGKSLYWNKSVVLIQ